MALTTLATYSFTTLRQPYESKSQLLKYYYVVETSKTRNIGLSTPLIQYFALSSTKIKSSTGDHDHAPNNIVRRTANYPPPIWQFQYIQSLPIAYLKEKYTKRADELKEKVRMMFTEEEDIIAQLQQIDTLQRLGLSYHFDHEINRSLKGISFGGFSIEHDHVWKINNNLYVTALAFRLLRQHGYWVPQEVFNAYKDKRGNFKADICKDTMALLSLYEASYYLTKGEDILEEARDFTTKHLQEFMKLENNKDINGEQVSHALELPFHWRMPRLEARWFIEAYQKKQDMNPIFLELAKLDFNIVQSTHQQDLKHMSRWWASTYLGEKLSFARDRLMENFFWTVGVKFEPKFEYFRRKATKVNALITVIDDIYDVYGTLDELEVFTHAVERWDVNVVDQLPDYMKIGFLALHNTINEMVFDVLKEQDLHITKYLKKTWIDICKSYLVEAKWYFRGHTPTFEEYIENAWVSISAPVILVHAYFFVTNPITKQALNSLEEYPKIIRLSSMILRLANDLGTFSDEIKRGDVPKSIQCYVHEFGASHNVARGYIKILISEIWKEINEERSKILSPFSQDFIDIAINLCRMAQCMYQHGDGHGYGNIKTKEQVLTLLVKSIPLCHK